jgi:cbb3-type cytochrome oxidase maturation protein
MDIILMLIPAALLISAAAFIVFYWSVKSDQYEDMEGEAYRILMDDDDDMIPGNKQRLEQGLDKEPQNKNSEQIKKSGNE